MAKKHNSTDNLYCAQHDRVASECLTTFHKFGPEKTLDIYDATLDAIIAARVAVGGYSETLNVILFLLRYWAPQRSNRRLFAIADNTTPKPDFAK